MCGLRAAEARAAPEGLRLDPNVVTLAWDPAGATGRRFEAHSRRGDTVVMDSGAEAVNGTPVDVLLEALGACSGMDVVDILRKKRVDLVAYELRLEGVRRDEHPRVYTRIEVVHRLRGRGLEPAAVEHAIELSDTKYCTVHGMLAAAGCELTSRYEIEEA